MISRQEYLNALEIIDKYHCQDNKEIYRILVSDWIDSQSERLPIRVQKALEFNQALGRHPRARAFKYLDEINKSGFLRCPNVGKKTWIDFCEISGLK